MEILAKVILIVWSTLVLFTDVFSFDTYYGSVDLLFKVMALIILVVIAFPLVKRD